MKVSLEDVREALSKVDGDVTCDFVRRNVRTIIDSFLRLLATEQENVYIVLSYILQESIPRDNYVDFLLHIAETVKIRDESYALNAE